MFQVKNVEKIDKGSLLAQCDVHIEPWMLTLKEVKIFQKGQDIFLGMPSRFYEKDGEKIYVELMEFDTPQVKKRFLAQVKSAVDSYLQENPTLDPEPVVQEDGTMPF